MLALVVHNHGISIFVWVAGDLVLGKYSDDNWYRARVVSLIRHQVTDHVIGAELLYVDYGNSEETPFDRFGFL